MSTQIITKITFSVVKRVFFMKNDMLMFCTLYYYRFQTEINKASNCSSGLLYFCLLF